MNRLSYYLNVLHYIIWISCANFFMKGRQLLHYTLDSFIALLMPPEMKTKFLNRQKHGMEITAKDLKDYKNGVLGTLFVRLYIFFYSLFVLPSYFIVYTPLVILTGSLSVSIISGIVSFGLCFIPLFKNVFWNDRYVKYFKDFLKNDEKWHKKWRWLTLLFCLISLGMAAIGVVLMISIFAFCGHGSFI